MTQEQLSHIIKLQSEWCTRAEAKYKKGVEEHGGNLWDMPILQLMDEAIMENIDQFVYLMTARDKIIQELEVPKLKLLMRPDHNISCECVECYGYFKRQGK